MKKGEVYQAVVEKMEFPNKGIDSCRWRKGSGKKCTARADH